MFIRQMVLCSEDVVEMKYIVSKIKGIYLKIPQINIKWKISYKIHLYVYFYISKALYNIYGKFP